MARQTFSAQVTEWVRQTEARQLAVLQQSAQDVIEKMQTPRGKGGRMPVDTGFLRGSLQISFNGDRPPPRKAGKGRTDYDPGEIVLKLASMGVGDELHVTYTADYSYFVEVGARGREPAGFVRLAAMEWQGIVAENCQRLRSRVEGRA